MPVAVSQFPSARHAEPERTVVDGGYLGGKNHFAADRETAEVSVYGGVARKE
jgi:hypothetical protein